ncbi:MAG: peptidylprolyl isomerase [Anaerolineaceae bacterium]
MLTKKPSILTSLPILILASILIASCGGGTPPATATASIPTAAPTELPPTPTSEPLAARVNGEGILLEDFNTELKVFQLALQKTGENLTAEEIYQKVLDDLIASTLLGQEADKAGQVFDEGTIQSRANELANQLGGEAKLTEWKQTQGYSDQAFLRALTRNAKAAWQRDQIMAAIPTAAEQVHVQQILVQDEAYANQILEKLKSGQDFSTLAFQNDPTTGGELGWFPRGFLFHPEVEEAAFVAEPGTFSGVIHSAVGYHILLVKEKDPNRDLGPEARSTLQKTAVAAWIKEKQAQSTIEVLIA